MIWEIGNHRLMCGDSLNSSDVSRLWSDCNPKTLIFDPPHNEGELMSMRPAGYKNVLSFTDHRRFFRSAEGWGAPPSGHFIWDCQTSMYIKDWPLIRSKYCLWFGGQSYNHRGAFYGDYQPPKRMKNSRGEYNSPGHNNGKHLQTIYSSPITKRDCMEHPHSKPVDWMRLLIGNCTEGCIYDMFAGSGTALIAAEQLERKSLSMEISLKNCELIADRMNQLFGLEAVRID